MKYVSIIYNALLWALALASVCFSSLWLQMRLNVGYVFFGVFALIIVVLCICLRGRSNGIGLAGTVASLMSCVLIGLVFTGPSALDTVPAAFIREGLHQSGITLGTINIVLIVLIAGGFIATLASALSHHDERRGPEITDDPDARLKRTTRLVRWATFVVLFVVVAVFSCVPALREGVGDTFARLSSGDIESVAELIRSYGPWAAIMSFVLMVLQSLAAPIPAFLITFANAAVFGWWQGALLSWSSAMAGAALCFWIARILGRDAVAHFVSHGALESVDSFFDRYGKNAILICRLLPFMSFDIVSYAAGLTGMGFWGFFWATGLGQLPATVVYSYVGGMLTGGAKLVMTALLILFALLALAFLVRQIFAARHGDLMGKGAVTSDDSSQR